MFFRELYIFRISKRDHMVSGVFGCPFRRRKVRAGRKGNRLSHTQVIPTVIMRYNYTDLIFPELLGRLNHGGEETVYECQPPRVRGRIMTIWMPDRRCLSVTIPAPQLLELCSFEAWIVVIGWTAAVWHCQRKKSGSQWLEPTL